MTSEEYEWVKKVTKPFRQVVGQSNTPPLPLKSVAKTQAGNRVELIKFYENLDDCQSEFEEPPDWVTWAEVQDFFADHPTRDRKLHKSEQKEKWFIYPKLRVLAAFREMGWEIPTERLDIRGDFPDEEVKLIRVLDDRAFYDAEDPRMLARDLRRQEELDEFFHEVYQEEHDLRQDIRKLMRPGVKFALDEAYKERIDLLDEVYHIVIDEEGLHSLVDQFSEATHAVRERRETVERNVEQTLAERVEPRLATIEQLVKEIEAEQETREPPSFVADTVEQAIHDLRFELGTSMDDASEDRDVDEVLAKLEKIQNGLQRDIRDTQDMADDELTELEEEMAAIKREMRALSETVEAEFSEVYEEWGPTFEGADVNARAMLWNMFGILQLQKHLAELGDEGAEGAGESGNNDSE